MKNVFLFLTFALLSFTVLSQNSLVKGKVTNNLNNEPIVETIEDALKTFYNSDIDYLFLPDIMKVIKNEKKSIN